MTAHDIYLNLVKHYFSEDVAQEVVVEFLEGKLAGARDLYAVARKRAKWRTINYQQRRYGWALGQPQEQRSFCPIPDHLPGACPTPFECLEQREALTVALSQTNLDPMDLNLSDDRPYQRRVYKERAREKKLKKL